MRRGDSAAEPRRAASPVRDSARTADHPAARRRDGTPAQPRLVWRSGAHVIDVLQRLREDEAVERRIGNVLCGSQIADDGGERVTRIDVEDVSLGDSAAKSVGVAGVADLEDASANEMALLAQEPLDVEAVDRCPAVVTEICADWGGRAKRCEPHRAGAATDAIAEPVGGGPHGGI